MGTESSSCCPKHMGDSISFAFVSGSLLSQHSHLANTTPRVNATTPLNCWEAVAAFKAEVGKLETAFVKSLQ